MKLTSMASLERCERSGSVGFSAGTWEICGKSMGNLWGIYGEYMDNLMIIWKTYSIWIHGEWSVVYKHGEYVDVMRDNGDIIGILEVMMGL